MQILPRQHLKYFPNTLFKSILKYTIKVFEYIFYLNTLQGWTSIAVT